MLVIAWLVSGFCASMTEDVDGFNVKMEHVDDAACLSTRVYFTKSVGFALFEPLLLSSLKLCTAQPMGIPASRGTKARV